ncbi:aspartate kinase [Parvicella tangerina]|uniref:Aspartokinase n=1 Tax=Parvicella tangerina TaxID=2829795 RepID=A0A916JJK2_9FLAO|nr:aspartate kinase [Parvicella tangerina]CAG5076295.1 Lysine-sensitive aspartokinase 3 [Parvicella tangerina]
MKVFKFGGASVKNAEAVENVRRIISNTSDDLMVVISAMGKMTNAFEELVGRYSKGEVTGQQLDKIRAYHDEIVHDLKLQEDEFFMSLYERLFEKLLGKLSEEPSANYDYEYDQVVSFGELISTTIISGFLNAQGVENEWIDARKIIRTDDTYREGKVDWELTAALFKSKTGALYQAQGRTICITQGFLGHTDTGQTTTLGREGSDYSAGIAAWCLDAESVTIWKDVPGMLNADPKFFNNTERLPKISFREAIELSYYGASVIHPKTIKPLQNKDIPLYVKSFVDPNADGTEIQRDITSDHLIPSYIFKNDQTLISISPRDFSFIVEGNLRDIFDALHQSKTKVNLMQNSAISFSICVNEDEEKLNLLMNLLGDDYEVRYNTNLQLMTVRHYNEEILQSLKGEKEVLLEQKSRHTTRFVMR